MIPEDSPASPGPALESAHLSSGSGLTAASPNVAASPSANIAARLHCLSGLLQDLPLFSTSFHAPSTIVQALDSLIPFLTEASHSRPENTGAHGHSLSTESLSHFDETPVRINRQTTAAEAFWYPKDTHIDYPRSSAESRIAHVFAVDPDPATFVHPKNNIAYGLGSPMGKHDNRRCELLKDGDGEMVLCKETTLTCQGVKICDRADSSLHSFNYTEATLEALQERLKHDISNPRAVLLRKTVALKATLDKYGCGCQRDEKSSLSEQERKQLGEKQAVLEKERRGHPLGDLCEGHLIFGRHPNGQAYVKCEHYSSHNRRHLLDHRVQETDEDYMEALFNNDHKEIAFIEQNACSEGHGPRVPCFTAANSSSMRVFCPQEHRDSGTEALVQGNMVSLRCQAKFQVYEPYDLAACPYIVILASGSHTHPPPLPLSTPVQIQSVVLDLLRRMDHELADATPRRFMRHPAVRAHLRDLLPMRSPTLTDLHISLANKDHLRVYIKKAKEERFPCGTGWEGVINYKRVQDIDRAPEDLYVRITQEVPSRDRDNTTPYRIIVCMTPAMSSRLARAQWIQSDISFKRAPGTLEFELVGWDRTKDRSDVYARAYVNRQSAEMHRTLLHLIDAVVLQDTGKRLQWRHIHSETLQVPVGTLQWAGDQHAGQALGIGMYLQDRSKEFPLKWDLHEPGRQLTDLSAYDHLRRIFRLCSVHVKRNIRDCKVSDEVKNMMRSLICVTHTNFEGTVQAVCNKGDKHGRDWVQDKLRAKFAFPGMCWQLSFIPKDVWLAGESNTNVTETAHADVYREGTGCTLLGALTRGEQFDCDKDRSLRACDETGVRHSYKPPSISARAHKNVKRTLVSRLKSLSAMDSQIHAANDEISHRLSKVESCREDIAYAENQLLDLDNGMRPTNRRKGASREGDHQAALQRAHTKLHAAEEALRKAEGRAKELKGRGSGQVDVLQVTAQVNPGDTGYTTDAHTTLTHYNESMPHPERPSELELAALTAPIFATNIELDLPPRPSFPALPEPFIPDYPLYPTFFNPFPTFSPVSPTFIPHDPSMDG